MMIDFVLILISYHALFVMKNTLLSDGFESHEKGVACLFIRANIPGIRVDISHFLLTSFSNHFIHISPICWFWFWCRVLCLLITFSLWGNTDVQTVLFWRFTCMVNSLMSFVIVTCKIAVKPVLSFHSKRQLFLTFMLHHKLSSSHWREHWYFH